MYYTHVLNHDGIMTGSIKRIWCSKIIYSVIKSIYTVYINRCKSKSIKKNLIICNLN